MIVIDTDQIGPLDWFGTCHRLQLSLGVQWGLLVEGCSYTRLLHGVVKNGAERSADWGIYHIFSKTWAGVLCF